MSESPTPTGARPGNHFHLHLSSRALIIGSVVMASLLAVIVVLAMKVATLSASPVHATAAAPVPKISESMWRFRGRPGPWGELEMTRIAIERPDAYVYIPLGDTRETRWFFPSNSPADFEQTLEHAGLDATQRQWLLDPARCGKTNDYWMIFPGKEFILNLSDKVRPRLYTMLGDCLGNPYYTMPLSWRAESMDELLDASDLTPATVALIRKLLYPRGGSICLSDMPTVLTSIPDEAEQRHVIKALSRYKSFLVKVRVRPDTDVPALVKYWGKGERAKDIEPLLESLMKVPDSTTIDVTHLLPPMPRRFLYTYHYPPFSGDLTSLSNCFWTAMNFFRPDPVDRFTELEETLNTLEREYNVVTGERSFGDVILFEKPGVGVIHAAVFIADDVVFTKNGYHHTQPWLLMSLDELLARYPSQPALVLKTYRMKDG